MFTTRIKLDGSKLDKKNEESLDLMIESMENRVSEEERSSQSGSCECLSQGFDDNYVPSFNR